MKETIAKKKKLEMVTASLYFSLEIKDKAHYFDFQNNSGEKVKAIVEHLKSTSVIPKYFEVIGINQLQDVSLLIAPMPVSEEREDMTYSDFLDSSLKSLDVVEIYMEEKESGNILTNMDIAEVTLSDNHLSVMCDGEAIELTDFYYNFPQRCVFALSFVCIGNKQPIARYAEKLDESIDLDDSFDTKMIDIFNEPSINVYDVSLLTSSDIYSINLKKEKAITQLAKSLSEQTNTIIPFLEMKAFVSFDSGEADIRLPFFTFDMYCKIMLAHEDNAEILYYEYLSAKQMLCEILEELGLSYEYVLGQRIDLFHEKEMQRSVIDKVFKRDIIENNIYFEASTHEAEDTKGQKAQLVTLSQMCLDEFTIYIITAQNAQTIVQQINAYVLDAIDLEETMHTLQNQFESLFPQAPHEPIEHEFELNFCPHHLQINGLFIEFDESQED